MTNANIKILTLYSQGLSPEQIAEAEGLELLAVKAVLFNGSAEYRKATGNDRKLDFDEDAHERALQVMVNMMDAEDEHLRFRAAKTIRDDAKGRLDAKAGLKGLKGLNVLLINQQLMQAAQALLPKSVSGGSPPTIEVESQSVTQNG